MSLCDYNYSDSITINNTNLNEKISTANDNDCIVAAEIFNKYHDKAVNEHLKSLEIDSDIQRNTKEIKKLKPKIYLLTHVMPSSNKLLKLINRCERLNSANEILTLKQKISVLKEEQYMLLSNILREIFNNLEMIFKINLYIDKNRETQKSLRYDIAHYKKTDACEQALLAYRSQEIYLINKRIKIENENNELKAKAGLREFQPEKKQKSVHFNEVLTTEYPI